MGLSDSFSVLYGIIGDLAASSQGVSTGEIVRKYRIHRRLVPKYISILEDAGIPIYPENKRYYLMEGYHAAFTLTSDESELLYLMLQRSLTYHAAHSQTFRTLLSKLGSKLTAPLAASVTQNIYSPHSASSFDSFFSTLAEAKRRRREVWVDYHPLNKADISRWRIRPLRFISNPLSDGLYIHCQGSQDEREYRPLSLRLDRILKVELTQTSFTTLDMAASGFYAGEAWGVWHTDSPAVQVQLRFEPRHYDRLLETTWHPSQRLHVEPDNHVSFFVTVSAPQEMIPWIRSWGSGVVVISPPDLRQHILHTLRRQIQAYGLNLAQAIMSDPLTFLWAKYNRMTGAAHLLAYHLLDVAAVAVQMWNTVLTQTQRDWLAQALGLEETEARQMVALLVGLHDIGKATPFFQHRAPVFYEELRAAVLSSEPHHDRAHGLLSAVILTDVLVQGGVIKGTAIPVALAIGGHHGRWITRDERQKNTGSIGGERWRALQTQLVTHIQQVLSVPKLTLPASKTDLNRFTTFLSGFVAVCDWIGSSDTFFPYEMEHIVPEVYWNRALQQASTALTELGWFGWHKPHDTVSFSAMFPPYTPNPVQQAIIERCDAPAEPYKLILIESLTGGGKTEIALYLADLLVNRFDLAGVYVAMPTQATSNQMFRRVSRYLEARYSHQTINVQLAHSQADQHPLYRHLLESTPSEGDHADENHLRAEAWFQNRKRSLLAPFAVGTVDQAMLSVLQVQHHFVRQYALAHKVVIFDEIHAYDTYMNEIIERLQNWLTALHAPMILLSATLPASTRQRLIAQAGGQADFADDVPYPRLTLVDHAGQVQVHPLPAPPTRTLHLAWFEGDQAALCDVLLPLYTEGGCIALINNTVDEAIRVAHALRTHGKFDVNDIILFHARFPSAWRIQIEQKVLSRFGKDGNRPTRAIVVATQIIEQSLDLDFDLIVTQLAPIDLLIQRAGRLHRHERPIRPPHLHTPTLLIRQPALDDKGLPDFGVDTAVYARYILLKTWLVLQGRTALHIPDEIDALMAFVYDAPIEDAAPDALWQAALQAAYDEMDRGDNRARFRGSQYTLPAPDSDYLFDTPNMKLADDEEHNIATREILPNIVIVCVRGNDADGTLPALPARRPTQDETALLLRHRVTVTRKGALEALRHLPPCEHWQRIPALRQARPIPFAGGVYCIPDSRITLVLSAVYGLEIVEDTP